MKSALHRDIRMKIHTSGHDGSRYVLFFQRGSELQSNRFSFEFGTAFADTSVNKMEKGSFCRGQKHGNYNESEYGVEIVSDGNMV